MPLKTHQEEPSLNLTPMIDIVFLLIIFFMVGTKFADMERQIKLQLPRVSSTSPKTSAPERKVINVYRDGTLSLNKETMQLGPMTKRLQLALGEYPDLGVVVRGDRTVTLQRVSEVLAAVQDAGIPRMAISVRYDRTQR